MKAYLLKLLLWVLLVMPVISNASDQDEIKFEDITFFSTEKVDRIYFGDDYIFEQQLEEDWEETPAGTLIEGTWRYDVSTQELCMSYLRKDIGNYCYNVVSLKDHQGNNQGVLAFDKEGNHQYTWVLPQSGNWLINPEYINAFKSIFSGRENLSADELAFLEQSDKATQDYLKGKILHGIKPPFETTLSYLKEDLSGVYRSNATQEKVPYTWKILKGRLHIYDKNGRLEESNIFTIGQEYLKPRKKLIYYGDVNRFHVEGNGGVQLTPIDRHPQKNFFD